MINDASVYDVAIVSPITFAKNLSSKLNDVYLKREDLQPIFSFKNRGFSNKINSLQATKNRGVIAASAGNHAQGVANAAKKIGIPCLIVMPITTPDIKVSAVRSFGAKKYFYMVIIIMNLQKKHLQLLNKKWNQFMLLMIP